MASCRCFFFTSNVAFVEHCFAFSIFVVAVFLITSTFSIPVYTKTETVPNKYETPCHVVDAEPPAVTEKHLTSLAHRTDELLYKIIEIKLKIIRYGAIIKNCVTSKFSRRNFSLPCRNTTGMRRQQRAECMVSSYNTVKQFSVSLKAIENDKFTSESKGNLKDILKSIEDLDIYTDQLLCEIQMDLKQLDNNISSRLLPHENNVSILSEYTEQTKTTDNKACFHVGSELSQIQIFHIIYQFLDTYFDVMQDMKDLSSEKYTGITHPDINESSTVSASVAPSPNETRHENNLLPIIIG